MLRQCVVCESTVTPVLPMDFRFIPDLKHWPMLRIWRRIFDDQLNDWDIHLLMQTCVTFSSSPLRSAWIAIWTLSHIALHMLTFLRLPYVMMYYRKYYRKLLFTALLLHVTSLHLKLTSYPDLSYLALTNFCVVTSCDLTSFEAYFFLWLNFNLILHLLYLLHCYFMWPHFVWSLLLILTYLSTYCWFDRR